MLSAGVAHTAPGYLPLTADCARPSVIAQAHSGRASLAIGTQPRQIEAMTIEYLDGPQAGWFALGVTRATTRKWDWIALMVDVDPRAYG